MNRFRRGAYRQLWLSRDRIDSPLFYFLVRNERSYEDLNAKQRNIRSPQAKAPVIAHWLKIFSGRLVAPFYALQRWFYIWIGDGHIATAVKG